MQSGYIQDGKVFGSPPIMRLWRRKKPTQNHSLNLQVFHKPHKYFSFISFNKTIKKLIHRTLCTISFGIYGHLETFLLVPSVDNVPKLQFTIPDGQFAYNGIEREKTYHTCEVNTKKLSYGKYVETGKWNRLNVLHFTTSAKTIF